MNFDANSYIYPSCRRVLYGKNGMVCATQPLAEALRRRGHDIRVASEDGSFGRGKMIWRGENGVLCGAMEPRADGTVAVW